MTLAIAQEFSSLDAASPEYATDFVQRLLAAAVEAGTSDLHLHPTESGLMIRWRMDGVLQSLGTFSRGETSDIVTRLKVLAGLLTYQSDAPQEGRLKQAVEGIEMRISTIPTVFGERAVVRLFGSSADLLKLDELGLHEEVLHDLKQMLWSTTGALLITGPAGSGKTTTAYAALRHLVESSESGRSIVSLEDPVEVIVPGVSQSQTNEVAGFNLCSGLKSILRQDPEVIFIGEIRDRETAEVAFQAAMTGQLVISTFHAGSAAEAINRLLEMDIEPYVLRSALLGVVGQRLARSLCECSEATTDKNCLLGFGITPAQVAKGCDACRGTGYVGRSLLAEILPMSDKLSNAVMNQVDTATLAKQAQQEGMQSLWDRAEQSLKSGMTSPQEIRRVLGWRDRQSDR